MWTVIKFDKKKLLLLQTELKKSLEIAIKFIVQKY